MKVSIVIVNYNVRDLVLKCLSTIIQFTEGVEYEIIVVDNASDDGSAAAIEHDFVAKYEFVSLIKNDTNLGFSKANNQGLANARGQYVLFMNPDMEFMENSLKLLVDYAEGEERLGALGCQLRYPDNIRQPNVKRFPTLVSQIFVLLKVHHFLSFIPPVKQYLGKDFDYRAGAEVDQIMGAFVFMSREVMKGIGGWNEDYYLSWEDVELCRTLKEKGWRVLYSPVTEVIHYESKSFETKPSFWKQVRFNRGMLTYFKNHHPRWQWWVLLALQPISLGLALLVQIVGIRQRPQGKI